MQSFDFEAFKTWCEENKAVPLVVLYGKEAGDGVDLNFINTEVYDSASNQLKQDVTEALGKIYQQMKG